MYKSSFTHISLISLSIKAISISTIFQFYYIVQNYNKHSLNWLPA